jgi:hypothetical protein
MIDVNEMDKDQLGDYAKNVFKVDLDMRKSIENLRVEVTKLQTKGKAEDIPVVKLSASATHIRNNDTGQHFPMTPELANYLKNWSPCDDKGNVVL